MGEWSNAPAVLSATIFAIGWCAGWVGFTRARRLPAASLLSRTGDVATRRSPVSVVIPCRDEANNLVELLPNLGGVLQADDQVIVVDDGSSDDTINVARNHGVDRSIANEINIEVVVSGALPIGWAGKPHACWRGVEHAVHDIVVFLDADVRLGANAVNATVGALQQHPDALVSVMPWHRTVTRVERLSMLFNVISSMVASVTTARSHRRVAYGPFMMVNRVTYLQSGGHSHQLVRGAVVEDLALARVMPAAMPLVGRQHEVEYRMYANGFRQLIEGWTKNTAIGAATVPRWSSAFIIAWVASLCGGLLTSPWLYVLSALQMFVFARRVGNFGVLSAVLYPIHAVVFVVVALRSAARVVLFGSVTWRGRRINTR